MSNIYFTSDSHYGHKNIIRKLSDWTNKDQCRDFNSIEEMNDELVRGINAVVDRHDTLWHLGDWNFGGLNNLHEFRRRVNCETIHLILGNHDFKHGSVDSNTVDHNFASVQHYKEIVVEGQEIILSHYALRVWNRQSKGSWQLYGHSHGKLPMLMNKSMDVGVDGFGTFDPEPWSFEDVKFMLDRNRIICEDEHNGSENSRPI